LIATGARSFGCASPRFFGFVEKPKKPKSQGGLLMLRTGVCLAAMLLLVGCLHVASAQTTTAPAATAPANGEAKPSHMKLTKAKLKEMVAKWSANRPKLKACRKEVKAKGLAGDDRWFYIADCMDKT
jgi:hypothetical protein